MDLGMGLGPGPGPCPVPSPVPCPVAVPVSMPCQVPCPIRTPPSSTPTHMTTMQSMPPSVSSPSHCAVSVATSMSGAMVVTTMAPTHMAPTHHQGMMMAQQSPQHQQHPHQHLQQQQQQGAHMMHQMTQQQANASMQQQVAQASTPVSHQHANVAQSQMPQVQVIQQPLHNSSYLQHLYGAQQQLLMPGNITLQGTAMAPSIQIMAAGKPMIQGQSNYIPSTTSQTQLLFGQLGLLSSQPSIITAHTKPVRDQMQNNCIQLEHQHYQRMMAQATTLQPKSHILPHPQGNAAAAAAAVAAAAAASAGGPGQQMLNPAQFKHLTGQGTLMSGPQLIATSGSPGGATMMTSQPQILSPLQAIGTPLPPGLTWAATPAPGSLQSPTLLTAQNSIFIRSSHQQQDMYIQPPQQQHQQQQHQHQAQNSHTPIQPAPPPVVAQTTVTQSPLGTHVQTVAKIKQSIQPKGHVGGPSLKPMPSILPSTAALPTPIRPASSVATQTTNVTSAVPHQPHFYVRPQQNKHRSKHQATRASQATLAPLSSYLRQKSDACNQTQTRVAGHHHILASGQLTRTISDGKVIAAKGYHDSGGVKIAVAQAKPATHHVTQHQHQQQHVIMGPEDVANCRAVEVVHGGHQHQQHQMQQLNQKQQEGNKQQGDPKMYAVAAAQKEDHSQQTMTLPMPGVPTTLVMLPPPPQQQTTTARHPPPTNHPVNAVEPLMTAAPSDGAPKEKAPQKAIVKPQVLTHVIEGYVIQEGPEPFPVSRSPKTPEFNGVKQGTVVAEKATGGLLAPTAAITVNVTSPNSQACVTSYGGEMDVSGQKDSSNMESPQDHTTTASSTDSPQEAASNDDKRGKGDRDVSGGGGVTSKCEFCGKIGVKARFKKSKRFCSTSCAKRYNVGCTRRLGLFPPTPEPGVAAPESSKHVKKRKHGIKSRKGARKTQSARVAYAPEDWSMKEASPTKCDESNDSRSAEESSLSPTTPPDRKDDRMDVDMVERGAEPEKDPRKWTVLDVFEFIKSMPGCVDYADEFRMQEIDGQALLLLKEDHLMSAMNMKLGPALKICARINSLRDEYHK